MHKGNTPQQAKAIYDKLTAIIKFIGEKLKAFLLRVRMIKECPPLALLLNIIWKNLATAVRKGKETK